MKPRCKQCPLHLPLERSSAVEPVFVFGPFGSPPEFLVRERAFLLQGRTLALVQHRFSDLKLGAVLCSVPW